VVTLQSIQERWPAVMRPVELVDRWLTPARWRCARRGSCGRHTARVDSTRVGSTLSALCAPLGRARRRALAGRPGLVRAEWEVRKLVWSLLTASAVAFRLRPKRPPVPKVEKRIDLLPAPATYPDFQAPLLVVPDDVSCAESSLLGDLFVQALHVVQDVYPVITTHQPPASFDPEQRLRDSWSCVYRLLRDPPRWHPELAAAAREGNLLGALAAGGPFAKLLERAPEGSAHPYRFDLAYLDGYEVRPGLERLGCRIHLDAPGGRLRVATVEHAGRAVAPGEDGWPFFERVALCALATHLTVWRHGMQYHVAGLAPVAVATHNLPPAHPLRRLLAAHVWETLSTNFYTHLTLRRNGFDVTGFSFPRDVIFRYYDDGARAFDLSRFDVAADAARRGIGGDLHYPWLGQARRYLDLIGDYVAAYVDHYWPDDDALAADGAVVTWFEELDRTFLGGIRPWVRSLTREGLIWFCTLFVYAVTVEHEENTMWDYAVFLPSTVPADGSPQSVGEVQSVLNFELVIGSATNRLLGDLTHLALDEGAARIMRGFQASLRALQEEMERDGDHYWRVYPRDLEASISA
jgi:arachidonate 15-lipoxygenase